MKDISERLQVLARDKNLDQVSLSRFLGKHPATISKWLSGKIIPHEKNTMMIAEKFKCSYEWLKDGTGEMFSYAPPSGDQVKLDFGNAAASREQDKKLAQMERALFKMQCPGHLDVLFDFIAENYGENKEGTEKFLAELYKTNAKYKLWCDEKKQRDGDPNYIQEQGNITVNGD